MATSVDPIAMLKADHEAVKALFDKFDSAKSAAPKIKAARQAIMELKIHAAIEEEIFYPAFGQHEKQFEDILLEAEEEHHVQHVLIGELDGMDDEAEHFDAKFTVLAENVRHHIQEEESEMLPKAAKLPQTLLAGLGEQMKQRKAELKQEMMKSPQHAGAR